MALKTDIAPAVGNALKPYLRSANRATQYRLAQLRAVSTLRRTGSLDGVLPPAFVTGCGRSGTTLLGQMLADHPHTTYLFEPYHLWTAIDGATDFIHLHQRRRGHCILRESDHTPSATARFNRLIRAKHRRKTGRIVEKTPINAMRLGYLSALVLDPAFVHIVRDGVDVARSIERLAVMDPYRLARRSRNTWWGLHQVKWQILAADGAKAGYYPDELSYLDDHAQRGAYEWLVSLHEVDRHRDALGPRLHELTYTALTGSPRKSLTEVADHLQLQASDDWLMCAANRVQKQVRPKSPASLRLPPNMCRDFNDMQARFAFANRALPLP